MLYCQSCGGASASLTNCGFCILVVCSRCWPAHRDHVGQPRAQYDSPAPGVRG